MVLNYVQGHSIYIHLESWILILLWLQFLSNSLITSKYDMAAFIICGFKVIVRGEWITLILTDVNPSTIVTCGIRRTLDHFTKKNFIFIQIRRKISFNITPSLAIRSLQDFAHGSTAVMSCAKFCSDHITNNWIRAKWNFHPVLNYDGKIVSEMSPVHRNGVTGAHIINHIPQYTRACNN